MGRASASDAEGHRSDGFYQEGHRLRDGAVLVYQRADTSLGSYQARLKVPGASGYIIRSLKTRDLREALNAAEDLFYSLKAEQKLGMDIRVSGNLKFKELWKKFYAAQPETGLSIHRQRLHKGMANKYFIPFFGEARVNDMPDAFVEKYWDWRVNYHNPDNWEDEEGHPGQRRSDPGPKDPPEWKRRCFGNTSAGANASASSNASPGSKPLKSSTPAASNAGRRLTRQNGRRSTLTCATG